MQFKILKESILEGVKQLLMRLLACGLTAMINLTPSSLNAIAKVQKHNGKL